MVAILRKRKAVGKAVKIQYKGRDIDLDKLERANKRFKGDLGSPLSKLQLYLGKYT